jgi:hypothetical protein
VWEAAAANAKFDAACHSVLVNRYNKMLCRICGFPSCGCNGCAERQQIRDVKARHQQQEGQEAPKTAAKLPHECWKHNVEGRPGKTDPIEKKPKSKQQREEAWAAKGCTLTLKWDGSSFDYSFQ